MMNDGSENRTRVILYTDGACAPNPGPGGWAYILKDEKSGRAKEESGGERGTTNNRMEMMAVIRGLEALKRPCAVEVVSDSEYVVNGIESLGIYVATRFHRSANSRKLIKNAELWKRLADAAAKHSVTVRWVRGHVGHPENEKCDLLATYEANRIAQEPSPVKDSGIESLFEAEESAD